jgi:hypothetical protein
MSKARPSDGHESLGRVDAAIGAWPRLLVSRNSRSGAVPRKSVAIFVCADDGTFDLLRLEHEASAASGTRDIVAILAKRTAVGDPSTGRVEGGRAHG